ncbi:MAG: alkaline phosphatase family protein [Deltaproteobacteria bacterium]
MTRVRGPGYSIAMPNPNTHDRLLLIGLDAADIELVERWTADGSLPNLAALKARGAMTPLATSARWLTGSPWPTFYTGRPASDHGIYHDFQWRQERMAFAAPSTDWLPVRPFWRGLPADVPAVVHDVPMTPGTEPFHGVESTGWGSHDKLVPPETFPREVLDQIRSRWGDSPIKTDEYGRASLASLRELHAQLLDLTSRSSEAARWLLRNPWRLGIVVFGALHRGGHRFWDRTSVDGAVPPGLAGWYDDALHDLYRAADRAVGALVASAPDATVFVFALHGMMVNTARVDLLDDMLARVLHGPAAEPPKPGLLRRAGEAIPLGLRRRLTNAVPKALKDRIMTRWTTGGTDWSRTRAFTLRADLSGYIRINLAGREPEGVVHPGELDALLERIAGGLGSFRDAATGEPLVAEVCRARDVFPPGERMDRLPDLIVRWTETSAATHEAIESPTLGRIARATPGRIPNGRSGNHRAAGWLLACGPGIPAGARLSDGDILDLAPTALARLRTGTTTPLAGKVIAPLVGAGGAPPAGS